MHIHIATPILLGRRGWRHRTLRPIRNTKRRWSSLRKMERGRGRRRRRRENGRERERGRGREGGGEGKGGCSEDCEEFYDPNNHILCVSSRRRHSVMCVSKWVLSLLQHTHTHMHTSSHMNSLSFTYFSHFLVFTLHIWLMLLTFTSSLLLFFFPPPPSLFHILSLFLSGFNFLSWTDYLLFSWLVCFSSPLLFFVLRALTGSLTTILLNKVDLNSFISLFDVSVCFSLSLYFSFIFLLSLFICVMFLIILKFFTLHFTSNYVNIHESN